MLAAKFGLPLKSAVIGWLPIARLLVENAATPAESAILAPPGMGVPLSLNAIVPRFPGAGATVAVNMTDVPPVVASGVATSAVVVLAAVMFAVVEGGIKE